MNVLVYVAVCVVYFSISFSLMARKENKRLRQKLAAAKEPEPMIQRNFRSIQA